MPNLRADTARFTLQIEALEDEMLVVGLRGVEQLSSPYRFELKITNSISRASLTSRHCW